MKSGFTIYDLEHKQATGKIRGFTVTCQEKPKRPKKSKYRNNKKEVDGRVFDSQKEAKRYCELKLMLKAGLIGQLELQVAFELKVNEKRVCRYKCDFAYRIMETGEYVVEDVKSDITRRLPVYRLKKKLMKEIFGIEIKEV